MFDEFLKTVAEKTKESVKIHENDYLRDGLWYCHKCNTPKQFRNSLVKDPINTRCECEKKAIAAAERERNIQQKRERCFSGDKKYYSYTFANDKGLNPGLIDKAKCYADYFDERYFKDGKGIILFGDVGCGKTFAACCIANDLIEKGRLCRFISSSQIEREYADAAANGEREGYLNRLNANELLVIDDLGVEGKSDFVQGVIKGIIDKRIASVRPLIITTNTPQAEFCAPPDLNHKRIYSRLFEICIPFVAEGDDLRKAAFIKNGQEFKKDMAAQNVQKK